MKKRWRLYPRSAAATSTCSGRYAFTLADPVARGELQTRRDPASAPSE